MKGLARQDLPTEEQGEQGLWLLVKNAISAVTATGSDFALVVVLVSGAKFQPATATALGCVLGAVVNYSMNRTWTFQTSGSVRLEAIRYALVSGSSLLLNASGVQLLWKAGTDYRVAWWLTRIVVFLGWNYPLHRYYVFNDSRWSGKVARAFRLGRNFQK